MKQYLNQVGGAQRDHFIATYLPQVRAEALKARRKADNRVRRIKRLRACARFHPEAA